MQQEMLPGHGQSSLFLHRSKGWERGWDLTGLKRRQGEKPTQDAVVNMLVNSCRWMDATCTVVSGELGLK